MYKAIKLWWNYGETEECLAIFVRFKNCYYKCNLLFNMVLRILFPTGLGGDGLRILVKIKVPYILSIPALTLMVSNANNIANSRSIEYGGTNNRAMRCHWIP